MTLADRKHDAQRCTRCSYCKFIPYENVRHPDFMAGCPAVKRYGFHAYASGGKFNITLSYLSGRTDITEGLLEAIYRCQMDGSCDISCKAVQELEPLENIRELRAMCVEQGYGHPVHQAVIEGLRKEDNMMQAKKADRGKWLAGLPGGVAPKDLTRDKAEVLFHAGCRYSFDEELHPTLRTGLTLLLAAGVDVGVMANDEVCCGGQAYEQGYISEFTKFSEHNQEVFRASGAKTVVTPCSDCFQHFNVIYDKMGKRTAGVEVVHMTQFLHRLLQEGRIRLTKEVPLTVTYHDPCHLGRLAEPWVHWQGKEAKVMNQVIVHDPPKKYRRGRDGVYDVPREILQSIPGLTLVEMYRTRESAWCCGSGGGVKDAYPDFALWTGIERIKEARAVGAEAIVSACGWCTRNLTDAARECGDDIAVYDIVDLVQRAM
jgi:Fe-S oxidoreductase